MATRRGHGPPPTRSASRCGAVARATIGEEEEEEGPIWVIFGHTTLAFSVTVPQSLAQLSDTRTQYFDVNLQSGYPAYEGDYLVFNVNYFINERTISSDATLDQVKPYITTAGNYTELSAYAFDRGISGPTYVYIPAVYGQNFIDHTGNYDFDWVLRDPYYNQSVHTYIYIKSVDYISTGGGCEYDKSKGENCFLVSRPAQ